MTVDLTVREAGPADGSRVEELRGRARHEAQQRRGGPELLRDEASDAGASGRVLVAVVDGVVLAYARLAVAGEVATLEELFCEPRARGVGLGHALVEAAADLARGAGCTALESVALPGDRETKNFFESHGMRARLLTVHRRLDDGAATAEEPR